jgi:hypothetical protein
MLAFASVGVASSLIYRLIDDSSECNFLDNRCMADKKNCDLCALMSTRAFTLAAVQWASRPSKK